VVGWLGAVQAAPIAYLASELEDIFLFHLQPLAVETFISLQPFKNCLEILVLSLMDFEGIVIDPFDSFPAVFCL
jgi:hypothetical protein